MNRQELINFLNYLRLEDNDEAFDKSSEQMVDRYLKLVNSQAPDKSQIISENEADGVFCRWCGSVIEPWSPSKDTCDKCCEL